MEKKICGIISEQELKKLLKMKMCFTYYCQNCPINSLEVRKRMSCTRIIQYICGKTPSTCVEAISFLCVFLKKIRRNTLNKI